MVKVISEKKNTIKLVRNNKIIERSLADYKLIKIYTILEVSNLIKMM